MVAESCRPTLVDLAQRWATERPNDRAYAFFADGERISAELSYVELDRRARAIARTLNAHRAVGKPVLVLCPAGLDYVCSLLGCFYAGAIAVPAYPPTRTGLARTMPRIRAICADCEPHVVLTTAATIEILRGHAELANAVARAELIAVDGSHEARESRESRDPHAPLADLPSAPFDLHLAPPQPDQPALLQYTSGSTSAPKGVLVTHAQLAGNAAIIHACSRLERSDRVLSWLPPYHDMGLVGGILQPLFAGALAILMPPEVFLRRPIRWLTTATQLRATALLAPNFALDACVRRITPDERRALDLSAVRVMYLGAEPIRAESLQRFAEAFAACGFRREAFFPCYGMAEATLMISGGDPSAAPIVRVYAADMLEAGRAQSERSEPSLIIEASSETAQANTELRARSLVGCGGAVLGSQLRIVDPETRMTLGERCVGEIWVQSAGVASGYWQRAEETEHTFRAFTADTHEGPMLRTGDLGFLDRGELFITGRLKDLIIIRGRNHSPQDIERTVQALSDALVLDAGAAFSIDGADGTEQLIVVQELDKRAGVDALEVGALLRRIPDAIRDAHDLAPAAIVLIKRGSLPKTSSGKVQRRATRAAFIANALDVNTTFRLPTLERKPASSTPRTRDTQTAQPRRTLEIESWLRARVASKLDLAADEIDPRETIARYGVDSALAAEIIEELQQWLGIRLDTTISYDHPTIAGLARALAGMSGSAALSASRRAPRERRTPPSPAISREREPIAIVGMSCRFPGAPDLASFWELLSRGEDAISEVPRERWDSEALYAPEPGTPGKMCTKWGGFVEEIDRFDAAFFGISPHEAARMDPQQRLFLEVAWEALEDAGIAPSKLAGSRSGVFAGVCTSDFAMLYGGELRLVDGDYGTGSAPSLVANRLSYLLDLKGPSETLDSACSSSLAALHHACQSLEQLDTDLAIVGGVNAVLSPEVSVSFSQVGALARDGRCKAFDQRADGFVRSEGAGVIVLKRWKDALRDRDRVYALVSGCALSHDGRSNGLSAPSGPAQRQVIERALIRAGITPSELDYVETHGVGTPIADAVEVNALASVLEGDARAAALRIGSAKTNVGHLEAASGMVSVIKVALALTHEQLPRQLHCDTPLASLASLPLRVMQQNEPWPRGERPRYAGASAFGFGGANAHVVLREAPAPLALTRDLRTSTPQPHAQLVTLSARTPTALSASVRRLSDRLERDPSVSLADVCFTLNTGRAVLGERLAIRARDLDDLRERLLSIVLGAHAAERGKHPSGVSRGSVKPSARLRIALVLSDEAVTAEALVACDALLAPAFEHCERVLRGMLDIGLLRRGTPAEVNELLLRPSYAHAAAVALAYALCDWLQTLAIESDVVYGSGASEYAAAAVAGCIPWDQAIVLATRRGILLEGFARGATQQITLCDAKQALEPLDALAIEARIPFISGSLGRALAVDQAPGREHWTKHLLLAPTAGAGLPALLAEECALHLELAPRLQESLPGALALLDRGAVQTLGMESLLQALGVLFVHGAEIDFGALVSPDAKKIALPTYPFERERHWLDFPDRFSERASERAASTDQAAGQSGARARSAVSNAPLVERPISHPLIARVRTSRPATSSGFIRKGAEAEEDTDKDKAGNENE